ncbi:MAG: TlpA disulfide reductase family protein [Planctomycetota bacterium]
MFTTRPLASRAGVFLTTLAFALSTASNASDSNDDVSLQLKVTDESGEPIRGAVAEVMKWTGTYEPIGVLAKANGDGEAELSFPFSEDYFYLKVKAASYATTVRGLPLVTADTEQSLELKLSRPATSWVKVNADNKPLTGAEVSALEFIDANNATVHLTFKTAPLVGFEFLPSDRDGMLPLPELPLGAKVTLTVIHPEWQSHRFEGLVVKDGKLGETELEPGVPIAVNLVCDVPDAIEELEGRRADVVLIPPSGGSSQPTVLRHSVPIQKGQIRMTGHAVEYAELRISLDDYFTFPSLMNYPHSPNARLNLEGREEAVYDLKIYKKNKARGRIVDHEGNGVADAYVSASVKVPAAERNTKESNDETPEADNSISGFIKSSISAGGATTDKDGYYEIEVTPGTVTYEVIHTGTFSSPLISEHLWSGNTEDQLPDEVLYPIPELKGSVLDQKGQPVSGSVVIVRHKGRGDADPVCTSAVDGSFSLAMSRIPYAMTSTELETEVYVLAFDPVSGQAGTEKVDLANYANTTGIQVRISDKSPDWPLNALGPPSESQQRMTEAFDKRVPELRRMYASGVEGKTPPAMDEGTWLNTDAMSLHDFRGKHVLLDFWFIGCGPCMRDLPSVKAAHQAYARQGFSVVAVNVLGQDVDDVRAFAKKHGMNYPIVVDDAEGTIIEQYKKLGIVGFPSYLLLGPDGRIIHNDQLSYGKSLRLNKLEWIHRVVRSRSSE